jgi:large subunit ribosomal protein L4e
MAEIEAVVRDLNGNEVEKVKVVNLPDEVDEDLLKRAYWIEKSREFQLKYPDPLAGKRKVVWWTKRRMGKHGRKYKTIYTGDRSRTPAKVTWHVGNIWIYEGAFVPQSVGGREAHPPSSEKKLEKKMNKKEKKLALLEAIAASMKKEFVIKYHKLPENITLPIVFTDDINKVQKTKELKQILEKTGLKEELERILKRKIRSTKGKMRGRRYKKRLGILFVTTDNSVLQRAGKNLNIIVKKAGTLKVEDVTQAGRAGRLIIWTKSALESLPIWLK